MGSPGVIALYADRLPITPSTPRITLFEGGTPCVPAPRLCEQLGLGSLHLKVEGLNPTGSFKDRGMVVAVARALEAVRRLAAEHPMTLVNSVNPYRIEGQKTAAFEIVDDLGDAPDVVAIPVGNAGNITAYWRDFREYFADGLCTRLPRMLGGQAAGAAPLVLGHPVSEPETFASAIRIGNPASWQGAIDARDQ